MTTMMAITSNFANTYADGMVKAADWATAHPVATTIFISAMIAMGCGIIVTGIVNRIFERFGWC